MGSLGRHHTGLRRRYEEREKLCDFRALKLRRQASGPILLLSGARSCAFCRRLEVETRPKAALKEIALFLSEPEEANLEAASEALSAFMVH